MGVWLFVDSTFFLHFCLQSTPKFWTKSTSTHKSSNLQFMFSLKCFQLLKKINILPSNMLWFNCQGCPHVFNYKKIVKNTINNFYTWKFDFLNYFRCQLLIYKSTTFLPCQSTIYNFLGQKKSLQIYKNSRKKV